MIFYGILGDNPFAAIFLTRFTPHPTPTSFSGSCASNFHSLEPTLRRFNFYLSHLRLPFHHRERPPATVASLASCSHSSHSHHPRAVLAKVSSLTNNNKYISVANIYSSHSKRKLCKIHFQKKMELRTENE